MNQAGADTDATNHDGDTPLHLAARKGYPPLAMALLEAGRTLNLRTLDHKA